MKDRLKKWFEVVATRYEKWKGAEALGPLLGRIVVGTTFLTTGWGKLHNLDSVTEFFTSLGIPAPGFHAALVSTTELVGGALLVLGLLARFAALPLATTMAVALLTAKRAEIEGIVSLFGQVEFLYLTVFLWIAIRGPGALSLDQLLGGRLARWLRSAPEPVAQERVALPTG